MRRQTWNSSTCPSTRTGRVLNLLMLVEQGLLDHPVLLYGNTASRKG